MLTDSEPERERDLVRDRRDRRRDSDGDLDRDRRDFLCVRDVERRERFLLRTDDAFDRSDETERRERRSRSFFFFFFLAGCRLRLVDRLEPTLGERRDERRLRLADWLRLRLRLAAGAARAGLGSAGAGAAAGDWER